MTKRPQFSVLDQASVFMLIDQSRRKDIPMLERQEAETQLYKVLHPVSRWFADLRNNPIGFDLDQVVNDSIFKIMMVYVRNPQFQFHSCGHIVKTLGKITKNQCNMACRSIRSAKRTPQDRDGHTLRIEPLSHDDIIGSFRSKAALSSFQDGDEVQHYLSLLKLELHQRIFLLLIAGFTWGDIAERLDLERKTVRRHVDQIRRILTPHSSLLTPKTHRHSRTQ